MDLERERRRRCEAHGHRMAEATRAIADWCENLAMMATYLELAAKWMQMAKQSPPVSAHETH